MFCPWDEQLLSECVSGSETAIFLKEPETKMVSTADFSVYENCT